MIKIFQRFGYQFKEYIILLVFVIISLISISQSEKPQAKKLKTFAVGGFAIVNEIANSFFSIFSADVSKEQLKYENAQLMLRLNKLANAVIFMCVFGRKNPETNIRSGRKNINTCTLKF